MTTNALFMTPRLCSAGIVALLFSAGIRDANAQDDGSDAAGDLTPKRYNIDRYKSIWSERSPFEIIVEEEAAPEPEEPPFEDYSLAGYFKRGNVWHVTVVNTKDPKEKHYLESGQVSKDGFELLNFKPERNYKNSEVVVRRGGKSGSIGFDEKRLSKQAVGTSGTPFGKGGKPDPNQQARGRQPAAPPAANAPNTPAVPGAQPGKADAAAQIRQMLQNRANQNQNQNQAQGGGGNRGEGERQPRRRVILPPSR